MSIWRPKPVIQVKALGLVWRKGNLLASEIYRDDGTVKGVRPLGGRVEFGESWRDALRREFQEELGVTVTLEGEPIYLENIYSHHGATGHELVILSDVLLPPGAFEDHDVIPYAEDDGTQCRARWFDTATLDCGDLALYPTGLKTALTMRRG